VQIVQSSQNFGFNYTAYDQDPDLNVAFNVYDVTNANSPIFLQQVSSVYADNGAYTGVYAAEENKIYLVIGLVYTDVGLTIVDTTRAQFCEVFQVFNGSILVLGFAYAAYDYSDDLDILAKIYNNTNGTPVLEDEVVMGYVGFGTYYGAVGGSVSNAYQVNGVVYEDDTFTDPDYNYAPSSNTFVCVQAAPGVNGRGTLVGQSLSATLRGDI